MPLPPIAPLPGKIADTAGYLGSVGMQQLGKQNKLFNTNNQSLDWITGPNGDPTSSPLYKSFLTKSRSSIGNSYDNAVMNSRANAASRGFGYSSPNTAQAEEGIRGSEASAIGAAPTKALQDTMPYNMEALGLRAGEAGVVGAEGQQDLGMYNQDENVRYQQQQQNKRQLYGSLSKLAGTALQAFAPGMGGGGMGDGSSSSGANAGWGDGWDG